jgi:hypothetical protein
MKGEVPWAGGLALSNRGNTMTEQSGVSRRHLLMSGGLVMSAPLLGAARRAPSLARRPAGAGGWLIGVFRAPGTPFNKTGGCQWLLRNTASAGAPDVQFAYGGPGDVPVIGDWTGSGHSGIGVFRVPGTPFNKTGGCQWLLRNTATAGAPDVQFAYGGPGDVSIQALAF